MKSKRIFSLTLLIFMLMSIFAFPVNASSRIVKNYSFTLTNSNEDDQHGLFDVNNGYQSKIFDGKPAAIRCTTYSNSTYNFKATLNWNSPTRATDFVWLNTNQRRTPSYLSGFGKKGQTFKLWARRDDRETVSSTVAKGSWSPDDKNY